MRKLIVSSFISLDSIIGNPWEWIGPYFDAQNKQDAFEKHNELTYSYSAARLLSDFRQHGQTSKMTPIWTK
jgi:hypothetical protein